MLTVPLQKVKIPTNRVTCWLWVTTHNASGWDSGCWAVNDQAAEVVWCPVTLHFDPFSARQTVREAQSKHLAMIVLNIFFKLLLCQTNNQPYFILKVSEAVAVGHLHWDCNSLIHLNCANKWLISNRIISIINAWKHLIVCKKKNKLWFI